MTRRKFRDIRPDLHARVHDARVKLDYLRVAIREPEKEIESLIQMIAQEDNQAEKAK